ncbi:hypothetical protein GCM10028807_04560 [Spirosoma daeguense]
MNKPLKKANSENINPFLLKLKYVPKIGAAIAFLVSQLIAFYLFFGRTIEPIRIAALQQLFPDFYQHVSNFTLSYALLTIGGFLWLQLGVRLIHICMLGAIIALANGVYERWIPILNTLDETDALYGFAGTLLGLVFLIIVKKYGLSNNPFMD